MNRILIAMFFVAAATTDAHGPSPAKPKAERRAPIRVSVVAPKSGAACIHISGGEI